MASTRNLRLLASRLPLVGQQPARLRRLSLPVENEFFRRYRLEP